MFQAKNPAYMEKYDPRIEINFLRSEKKKKKRGKKKNILIKMSDDDGWSSVPVKRNRSKSIGKKKKFPTSHVKSKPFFNRRSNNNQIVRKTINSEIYVDHPRENITAKYTSDFILSLYEKSIHTNVNVENADDIIVGQDATLTRPILLSEISDEIKEIQNGEFKGYIPQRKFTSTNRFKPKNTFTRNIKDDQKKYNWCK